MQSKLIDVLVRESVTKIFTHALNFRFWSWPETRQRIWRSSVSPHVTCNWPLEAMRNWILSSKQPLLVVVSAAVVLFPSGIVIVPLPCFIFRVWIHWSFVSLFQVSSLISISHWLERRDSRRLYNPVNSGIGSCHLRTFCLNGLKNYFLGSVLGLF